MTKHAIPLGRFAALSIALVFALTVTVAIVAVDHVRVTGASPANAVQPIPAPQSSNTRFDGGPEEGTRGTAASPSASTRYDGGPEKGVRGTVASPSASTRFDGGPEEGTRGSRR